MIDLLARPATRPGAAHFAHSRLFPSSLIILLLVVAAATGVRTLLQPARHTVFPIFATASHHWWHDQPLYVDYAPLDYFRYPPVFAVFVSPFAALSLRMGGVLWTWLGLGVYASGLWQFRRHVLPGIWTPRRELAFFALATAGALAGLWNAQSNALVAGLLLWAAVALVRGENWTCAGWLAVAISLKPTPLPVVLLLCALWPRRLAVRFVLALLAIACVPFLTRPPATVAHHYADWIAQQRLLANERWPGFRDGWTVWQVVRHGLAGNDGPIALTAPIDSSGYRLLQAITGVACLAWCLARRFARIDERELVLQTLGMGTAWLMLFGPAVEHPTYVLLAPFLAAAVVGLETAPVSRILAIAASMLILTFGWGAVSLRLVSSFPSVLSALPAGTALYATGLAIGCFSWPHARSALPREYRLEPLSWRQRELEFRELDERELAAQIEGGRPQPAPVDVSVSTSA
jgi:Glycosyltransferase family 87